ncbi:MAG: hypothetical protein IJ610_01550 [Bacteroidaceae bacterium]|nr:hypothetical protein [Bacteroidaceae bacterium]
MKKKEYQMPQIEVEDVLMAAMLVPVSSEMMQRIRAVDDVEEVPIDLYFGGGDDNDILDR